MKFVWLSRKDTPGTTRQVVANNGAWVALCGTPPKYDGPKDPPKPKAAPVVYKAPEKVAKPNWFDNLWYPASWK
jgi:hypothetical protein